MSTESSRSLRSNPESLKAGQGTEHPQPEHDIPRDHDRPLEVLARHGLIALALRNIVVLYELVEGSTRVGLQYWGGLPRTSPP